MNSVYEILDVFTPKYTISYVYAYLKQYRTLVPGFPSKANNVTININVISN